MITDQRIIFEAAVLQPGGLTNLFVHQSGSIPMGKVSYVGTSTQPQADSCGCNTARVTTVRINSSGGEIVLAVPTQEEASSIQGVIEKSIASAR